MNVFLMSYTDTKDMKTLCALIFVAFLAVAIAEDSSIVSSPGTDPKTLAKLELQHESKSTKAYKRAKEACVNSSNGKLKGKN
jgi:hypothetical protein